MENKPYLCVGKHTLRHDGRTVQSGDPGPKTRHKKRLESLKSKAAPRNDQQYEARFRFPIWFLVRRHWETNPSLSRHPTEQTMNIHLRW